MGAALLMLWLPLIHLLGAQWSVYEQYNYGWAVPFLCTYLFWRRWPHPATPKHERPTEPSLVQNSKLEAGSAVPWHRAPLSISRTSAFQYLSVSVFSILLLALLPTRILQEANPLWRLASYALTLEVIALTLLLIVWFGGKGALRHFAFPIVFFLVAVPWPTPVETTIIQSLTRLNTAVVIEIMNTLGVAALAHGNVIEVSTGLLGIDEACSGIRSTQVVFMLALFFGERHRLRRGARFALLAGGLAIAMVLNIIRTSILVGLAARGGLALAEKWHDFTGVTVLLGCFSLIWAMAARSHRPILGQPGATGRATTLEDGGSVAAGQPTTRIFSLFSHPRSLLPAVCVLFFSLLSVVGSELWFRAHERQHPEHRDFTIQLPRGRPGFMDMPQSEAVRAMLRYDREACAKWNNPDGTAWNLFYFRWNPARRLKDRVRVQLAKSHRPEACLPAGGWKLAAEFAPVAIKVGGVPLNFRTYKFDAIDQSIYVFFCVQEDGTPPVEAANMRESHAVRWQAAWAGNRGLGQRSIEIAIGGARDAAHAEALLRAELPRLIQSK